jgi:hypothetical protein
MKKDLSHLDRIERERELELRKKLEETQKAADKLREELYRAEHPEPEFQITLTPAVNHIGKVFPTKVLSLEDLINDAKKDGFDRAQNHTTQFRHKYITQQGSNNPQVGGNYKYYSRFK